MIGRLSFKAQRVARVSRSYLWGSKGAANTSPATQSNAPAGKTILEQTKEEIAWGRSRISEIQEIAVLEYKQKSPAAHWNPDSPDYVPAQRDEEEADRERSAFNTWLTHLKTSIKAQEEIYQKIEQLDRPYLRGTPGLETNVYKDGVRDYSNPTGHSNSEWYHEAEIREQKKASNKHRFVNDVVYTPKWRRDLASTKAWQQEVENRPVDVAFHQEKGFKFDVYTPYEQRHPHVADRLGYPEFLGSTYDRLFRLENEAYHPNYLDQPFVQTPPIDADSQLNFGEGEVIYENPNALEWARFSQFSLLGLVSFLGIYKPYNQVFKCSMPSGSIFEDLPISYFDMNMYSWDTYFFAPVVIPMIAYSVFTHYIQKAELVTARFASRVQYNADKELLFITHPGLLGKEVEHVVEMEHVEVVAPFVNIGVKFLSSLEDDGYIHIKDTSKNVNFYLSKRQALWNPALREDFLRKTTRFWDASIYDAKKDADSNYRFEFVSEGGATKRLDA